VGREKSDKDVGERSMVAMCNRESNPRLLDSKSNAPGNRPHWVDLNADDVHFHIVTDRRCGPLLSAIAILKALFSDALQHRYRPIDRSSLRGLAPGDVISYSCHDAVHNLTSASTIRLGCLK